ncbi:MAG: type II toxin-antitoxin system RelE/ParE family toxin [Bacteroidales bacterium]|nr:type II toxin-antitoxin system RelE/ParE family toxin [Bacteroidales bacterium]
MASREIIWSARAKFDQLKILDFYYQINGTKTYSLKLYSNFKSAVKLIGKQPEIGLKTDNVNVRNLIVGYFALFYRINEQSIENIAIWDSRQDPENLKL